MPRRHIYEPLDEGIVGGLWERWKGKKNNVERRRKTYPDALRAKSLKQTSQRIDSPEGIWYLQEQWLVRTLSEKKKVR